MKLSIAMIPTPLLVNEATARLPPEPTLSPVSRGLVDRPADASRSKSWRLAVAEDLLERFRTGEVIAGRSSVAPANELLGRDGLPEPGSPMIRLIPFMAGPAEDLVEPRRRS
jgi:hypothetical protein